MKRLLRKSISTLVVVIMIVVLFTVNCIVTPMVVKAESSLDKPIKSGYHTTYDYIYFGNYPQAEIVSSGKKYTSIESDMLNEGDIIVSDELYNKLESATDWDDNGDIVINNIKYKRIKKEDATYYSTSTTYTGYYSWSDWDSYHYFKYEPIRWRILDVSDDSAFLLADIALDNQFTDVSWELNRIRSWLNGYDSNSNVKGIDYSDNNFINMAFTEKEQEKILETNVSCNQYREDYGYYSDGEEYVSDKIFLLSHQEVCTSTYGYYKDDHSGLITISNGYARECKSSAYAKAMGVCSSKDSRYEGNCMWWLRNSGDSGSMQRVLPSGDIDSGLYWKNKEEDCAVRPALRLNLKSNELYSYGGTVCSDHTYNSITIIYDGNGAYNVPSSSNREKHNMIKVSDEIPIREGYTFLGWSTDRETDIVSYLPGDEFYIQDESVTLYAIWLPNKYTLAYDMNGGIGEIDSQIKIQDQTLVLSMKTPIRDGYTFLGWSAESKASEPSYLAGQNYDINCNMTLYAIWIKNVHSIYYDAHYGSGAPNTQTKEIYNTIFISTTIPERNGYTFLGWSTNSNSDIVEYKPRDSYSKNSDLNLYAVWQKNSDGIIDSDNQGTSKNVTTKKNQTIIAKSITKTYSNKSFSLNTKTTGNGKLTYKSSNTKVAKISSSGKVTMVGYGKAAITITASETNSYKIATKKIEITVNPKKAKLSKIKSPKKESMKINWKKDKLVTGYQVQFSTNKKFKKGLRQRYFNKNQKSIIVPLKNKSGKRYYVRVRSYKRMNGVDYYGKWSSVKSVKIK